MHDEIENLFLFLDSEVALISELETLMETHQQEPEKPYLFSQELNEPR